VYTSLANLKGSGCQACLIDSPALSATAGTPHSWFRIVIDPYAREYYSFEAPVTEAANSQGGRAILYDMRGIKMAKNGAATRALYLPFVYAHSSPSIAAAEPFYSFDWCVSVVPAATIPTELWF
jgi:hypothetical protein